MATSQVKPVASVQELKKQVMVDALIDAAWRGVEQHGLDVTVDDIATLAGVGRRTVFRYFATRDDLLYATLTAARTSVEQAIPKYTGGDWVAWLTDLAAVWHEAAARAGLVVWELKTRSLPPRLAEMAAQHEAWARRVIDTGSATLWQAAGGTGKPPKALRDAYATYLSSTFTQAVLLHAGGTPRLAAELATHALTDTVRRLLSATT